MEAINKYYEEHSIYRSFIICDCEESAEDLVREMRQTDFTVTHITGAQLEDERPSYLTSLLGFQSNMERVLVMSYHVFMKTQALCTTQVLPYQNLIIYYNLESNEARMVREWLKNSEMRGFVSDINILCI
jgi:hypothetical protein